MHGVGCGGRACPSPGFLQLTVWPVCPRSTAESARGPWWWSRCSPRWCRGSSNTTWWVLRGAPAVWGGLTATPSVILCLSCLLCLNLPPKVWMLSVIVCHFISAEPVGSSKASEQSHALRDVSFGSICSSSSFPPGPCLAPYLLPACHPCS